MLELISDYLKMHDVECYFNFDLSAISTVRIGGVARAVAYPDTVDKLIKTVDLCNKYKIRFKILGRMSNVLFCNKIYAGIIIKTDRLSRFSVCGNRVNALAGCSLPALSRSALIASLSGLEELSGIPSSLGGAVHGNAGAFSRSISELIESVRLLDTRTLEDIEVDCAELNFDYRSSILKRMPELVVTEVRLLLIPSDSDKMRSRIDEVRRIRNATQPTDKPSLGSVFKRYGSVSAGELIDKAGLKGLRIGGAEISSKHAGFIINAGGADADDYIAVMNKAREAVRERFSVLLEPEIETVNFTED